MKYFLLSTAVVLALTTGGYIYEAAADTGAAAPGVTQLPGPPGQWNPGHGPWDGPGGLGPWGPGGRGPGGPGFRPHGDDKFSLFAPVKNKNLSDADVKIIATALLLEHGNHSWGVSNVVAEPDKSMQFSYVSAHGDIIATFAIDPDSGRIKRVS